MIKRFSVKNYRGFSEKIIWDLSASNYTINEHTVKDGIVKNAIILGNNGSGKSNIGLALFDIAFNLSDGHKIPGYYQNFLYAGGQEAAVVEFEYLFIFHGVELFYRYTKDKNGKLQSEELLHDDDLIFSWGKDKFYISDNFEYDKSREEQIFQRENAISVAKILYSTMALSQDHYLITLKDFVDRMLWFRSLEDRNFIGLDTVGVNIYEYIISEGLVGKFQKFLKETSEQEFDFSVTQREDKEIYCCIAGERLEFSKIQSTGTSHLTLLFYWLSKMKQNSLVFIDEFDAFYHFELAFNVCKILFELEIQVFLTSHNTALITNDLLRPDCYYIIDGKQLTSLNKLTNKEIRYGHNLEKMYRGKTFGL